MDQASPLFLDFGLEQDLDQSDNGHLSDVASVATAPPDEGDPGMTASPSSNVPDVPDVPQPAMSQRSIEESCKDVVVVGKGKGKGKGTGNSTMEGPKAEPKAEPLRLLDLPMDVLTEIVKQVTHTNDLTSLALTHSALHRLTIPQIYSRFDIVWPDALPAEDPSTGVDALTYGLATLVMAEEVFLPSAPQKARDGVPDELSEASAHGARIQWRKGNWYAQYTRKFSIGNGPSELVAEYLVSKERGKMLGTLVALAVARMPNLETFIWDMPSGVLRDVWLALASLGDRPDARDCRLKQVWVRWHDNSQHADGEGTVATSAAPASAANPAPVATMVPPSNHVGASLPQQPGATAASAAQTAPRVERPTFSLLPPLDSLTVLDVDEQAYLDEMSVLIGKSQHRLRELRVGISTRVVARDWVKSHDSDELVQVDHEATWYSPGAAGPKRLGGVLGVLLGRVHDLHRRRLRSKAAFKAAASGGDDKAPVEAQPIQTGSSYLAPAATGSSGSSGPAHAHDVQSSNGALMHDHHPQAHGPATSTAASHCSVSTDPEGSAPNHVNVPATTNTPDEPPGEEGLIGGNLSVEANSSRSPMDGKLRLDVLELERVPLYVPAFYKAFDWSNLTTLTILNCPNHEQLWKTLRRVCGAATSSPLKPGHGNKVGLRPMGSSPATYKPPHRLEGSDYPLKLKAIHTDMVSHALMLFLRETLAPNSLEVLLLQHGGNYASLVSINAICRGPLRRHRKSLKKVLIDSSERFMTGEMHPNSQSWKKWVLTNDVLSFVVSGKMSALRELGMAIDPKDWHFFLQRLPLIPRLRSLYVTHMAESAPNPLDAREMALQVVDIVTLRPEIELCYLAISNKCFEIVEGKLGEEPRSPSPAAPNHPNAATGGGGTDTDLSDADDDDDDDMVDPYEDDDDDEDDGTGLTDADNDPHENDSDASLDSPVQSDDDLDSQASDLTPPVTLRLREILFYDERVSIFKARHGRL